MIEEVVNTTFLYFKISYTFAPSGSIIFKFGIFFADLIILDLESLSVIINEFYSLDLTKKSLNNFVLIISFLKSSTT